MGNAGIPVADSFRYLAKLIQYCKVLKIKLKKLKNKKHSSNTSYSPILPNLPSHELIYFLPPRQVLFFFNCTLFLNFTILY